MIKRLSFPFVVVSLAVSSFSCSPRQESYRFPYQDPNLPLEARVDDLVARMTLEEKVSQMLYDADAIERLEIPAYNWWSEALHGVARAGRATVFPQAIGLAATWDTDLMFRVATTISDEARAKHHEYHERDDPGREAATNSQRRQLGRRWTVAGRSTCSLPHAQRRIPRVARRL